MRVFVTGASGWIGTPVVAELVGEGHEVVGLARSPESASALTAAGARPHTGSLDDLDSLREAVGATDGVIHLAFKHDFSDFAASGRSERAAVQAIGDVLEGTGKPFLLASGVAFAAPGQVLTEDDASRLSGPDAPRGGSEHLAMEYATRGVRSVGLRFAPTVHGPGDKGFTAQLVRIAREKGVSAYVGDGANRWPAVQRLDAAHLVCLALESAQAGSVVHAVDEEGIPTRDIAEAIGRQLGVPTASLAPDDVTEHFGWLGSIFALDIRASSALTRDRLGWTATHPGLLEELEAGVYTGPSAGGGVVAHG